MQHTGYCMDFLRSQYYHTKTGMCPSYWPWGLSVIREEGWNSFLRQALCVQGQRWQTGTSNSLERPCHLLPFMSLSIPPSVLFDQAVLSVYDLDVIKSASQHLALSKGGFQRIVLLVALSICLMFMKRDLHPTVISKQLCKDVTLDQPGGHYVSFGSDFQHPS